VSGGKRREEQKAGLQIAHPRKEAGFEAFERSSANGIKEKHLRRMQREGEKESFFWNKLLVEKGCVEEGREAGGNLSRILT